MANFSDNLPRAQRTGEVLQDKTKWRSLKLKSLAVSDVISNDKREFRMRDCSTSLAFAVSNAGEKRLMRANFCRDRMCPACQTRRSLVIFHQLKSICLEIEKDRPEITYLMLTLTVPNVPASELSAEITHLMGSFNRLMKRKKIKKVAQGYFRGLEVTYNQVRDDYHPHFHVLIAVRTSYFTSRDYLSQQEWLEEWQGATGYDGIKSHKLVTQVDVRKIKAKEHVNKETGEITNDAISSAAAEVGKYATKHSDYIAGIEQVGVYMASERVVNALAEALAGRRLLGWGGLMDEYRKRLQLADAEGESVDLVDTDGESDRIDAVMYQVFFWNFGSRQYFG